MSVTWPSPVGIGLSNYTFEFSSRKKVKENKLVKLRSQVASVWKSLEAQFDKHGKFKNVRIKITFEYQLETQYPKTCEPLLTHSNIFLASLEVQFDKHQKFTESFGKNPQNLLEA